VITIEPQNNQQHTAENNFQHRARVCKNRINLRTPGEWAEITIINHGADVIADGTLASLNALQLR